MLKIPLCLIISLFFLTACTGQPQATVIQPRLEIPETLLTCAGRPARPCPAAPSRPKRTLFASNKPAPKETACTDHARMVWESLLINRGDDCQSKLDTVRGLLKEFTPPVNPARNQPPNI